MTTPTTTRALALREGGFASSPMPQVPDSLAPFLELALPLLAHLLGHGRPVQVEAVAGEGAERGRPRCRRFITLRLRCAPGCGQDDTLAAQLDDVPGPDQVD